MPNGRNGLFIVFEGGEGSGKTTQAKMLVRELESRGITTLLTREPGDSALGAKLRDILLNPASKPISAKAQALLFLADRAEHIENVVLPALKHGKVVVCDRYTASTIAYQCAGGGLNPEEVRNMSEWASDTLYPDVTFYLDIDPHVGVHRAERLMSTSFERLPMDYHERVRAGFLDQVNFSWEVVNAERSICDVHRHVLLFALGVLNKVDYLLAQSVKCPDCRLPMARDADDPYLYFCDNNDSHNMTTYVRE